MQDVFNRSSTVILDVGALFPSELFCVSVQLIASLPVEEFAVAVLPGVAGLDEQGLGSNLREPGAHDLRRHLSAVVRSDVLRHAPHAHHVGRAQGLS